MFCLTVCIEVFFKAIANNGFFSQKITGAEIQIVLKIFSLFQ
jgi:hypothetical protein